MTVTSVLFALAILLLLLAAHPFVTYPASLAVIARLRPRRPSAPLRPRPLDFSLCMCAYNEEDVIQLKLRNLLALREREPGLEILIYVDAASDATARRLRAYAPHINVHVSRTRRGKTYGMNLLARRAKGDVLVFTDANVILAPDCLDNLRADFAAPDVGCVCGNLKYTNGEESPTAATGSLYWRFEEALKRLEERTGSVMGADGSLFAIRRSLHRPPPDHIIDDMYVSFMVLIQGYRIVQSRTAHAYERSATSSADEFRRKARIACQAFNVHKLLWPQLSRLDALTVYKYVSHKLLRWLSIYFLAASALLFVAGFIAVGAPSLALGFVAAIVVCGFVGARWHVKPLTQVVDVVMSLAGAGLGVWKSVRGESYQTWTPVASIRNAASSLTREPEHT